MFTKISFDVAYFHISFYNLLFDWANWANITDNDNICSKLQE